MIPSQSYHSGTNSLLLFLPQKKGRLGGQTASDPQQEGDTSYPEAQEKAKLIVSLPLLPFSSLQVTTIYSDQG